MKIVGPIAWILFVGFVVFLLVETADAQEREETAFRVESFHFERETRKLTVSLQKYKVEAGEYVAGEKLPDLIADFKNETFEQSGQVAPMQHPFFGEIGEQLDLALYLIKLLSEDVSRIMQFGVVEKPAHVPIGVPIKYSILEGMDESPGQRR